MLFAASGIAGLQTLAVAGELQHEVISEIDSETFFSWNSNSGHGRQSCYSCKLFSSFLCCADGPMLHSYSWTEGKACLPKIVFIVQKTFFVQHRQESIT